MSKRYLKDDEPCIRRRKRNRIQVLSDVDDSEDDEPCIRRRKRNRIQVLSDNEEPEYKIEKIRTCKFKDNKWFFLIKWLGYPESDNSWEPKENLNEEALKSISDIPIDIDSEDDEDTEPCIHRPKRNRIQVLSDVDDSEYDVEEPEYNVEIVDDSDVDSETGDPNSARYLFNQQNIFEDKPNPDKFRPELYLRCLNEKNGFIKHSEQLGGEIGLDSLKENASNKFELPRTGIKRKTFVKKGMCDVCTRIRTLKYSAFLKFKTNKGECVEQECTIGPYCALKIRFLYLFRRVLIYLDNNKKTLEEITHIFNILRNTVTRVSNKVNIFTDENENKNKKKPFGKFNGRIHFPMDKNIPCSF